MPAPITITNNALQQIQVLLEKKPKACIGLRIGLKTKGCNGLAYNIEYATDQHPLDECIIIENIRILIDPKAILFLIGTQMDYIVDKFHSGFTFNNPNEKGRCGCGKSFHV